MKSVIMDKWGERMLILAKSLKEISFSGLMEVYIEGNLENSEEFWPDLPENNRLLRAEQEFYQYLRESFFVTKGAIYAIWQEDGRYVSALRLEPYRDGLLLEALETAPLQRRKGYAENLLKAVQTYLSAQNTAKVYSHVGKKNTASLAIHEKCGFQRIAEQAVYIDGSVNSYCCTMCWESGMFS